MSFLLVVQTCTKLTLGHCLPLLSRFAIVPSQKHCDSLNNKLGRWESITTVFLASLGVQQMLKLRNSKFFITIFLLYSDN